MIILAIDPGASGGLALLTPDGVTTHPMPDTPMDCCQIIQTAKALSDMHGQAIHCYLEQVGGFVQGNPAPGSAMFNFGRNFGQIEGFLYALEIPFDLVTPQKWQKGVGLTFPPSHKGVYQGLTGDEAKAEKKRVTKLNSDRKRDNKNKIKEMAQRLFPSLKVTLRTADALMILQYGRQQQQIP
jgi:hypothetical protein